MYKYCVKKLVEMQCSCLFFVILYFAERTASHMCNVYQHNSSENSYVVADYPLPDYIEITKKDVSCPSCDDNRVCLRKCCLHGESLNDSSNNCGTSSFPHIDSTFEHYTTLIYGFCDSTKMPHSDNNLTELLSKMNKMEIEPLEYCVDYFLDLEKFGVRECSDQSEVDDGTMWSMACSELLLVVTFCIYASSDELRASFPNKMFLCYLINLVITNGIIITLQVLRTRKGTFCIMAGKYDK